MAKTSKVSQKKWVKGVNAAAMPFAQPPGSFPRDSNLVYSSRGALKTVDGSKIFSAFGGVTPLTFSPLTSRSWRELFFYNPSTGALAGTYGLLEDPNTPLATATGTPVLSATGTGLTGTFYVKVTALDGIGGESAASVEASLALVNQALHITWSVVANAFGYNVYVGTASGAEVLVLPTGSSPTSIGPTVTGSSPAAFTYDTTAISNSAQKPPTTDTTQQLLFLSVPPGGYSNSNTIFTFPPCQLVAPVAPPASVGSSTSPSTTVTTLRPTLFIQGGPKGGVNAFTSLTGHSGVGTDLVEQADAGTEETWYGIPATSGTVVALLLNVTSSVSTAGGSGITPLNSINYSLDGGTTWHALTNRNGSYGSRTDSASIPVSQNTTTVRVAAWIQAKAPLPGFGESATMTVSDISISATTQLSSGSGILPSGGLVGVCSTLPQILQFRDLMILILGNGIAPYSSNGLAASTLKLVNNFQASYASRTASTAQNVGDQISVTITGTNYVFTCSQAGVTGSGGAPAFSAVESSVVADGTVYWKNSGKIAVVTPPRGAAHGIVYAGSLWIANTFPTTTSDNFDGPSCLKMSDLNNPNSWNPLNVAFLDRDDGTQITGLATFTIAESGIPPVGSLVAFKDFSTFQINGVFGASNFSIARAQTDMGNVAPRSVQFVPGFGIVRLTHLGFAMFDGVRDRLLSEEIRPYLFGGQSDITPIDWSTVYFTKAAQVANPPMYVAACPLVGDGASLLTTLAGVSTILTTPGGSPTLPSGNYYVKVTLRGPLGEQSISPEMGPFAVVAGTNGLQVTTGALPAGYNGFRAYFGVGPGGENQFIDFNSGPLAITAPSGFGVPPTGIGGQMTRLFCYDLVLKAWTVIDLPFPISVLHQFRPPANQPYTEVGGSYDTTVRKLFEGDADWDGTTISWSVRTPEVFGKDASDRVYFRQLALRGTGNPTSITATVTVSGRGGTTQATRNLAVTPMGGGEFVAYLDIGVTGVDAHATIQGSGLITIESVDWFAVAKAIRGKVTV